MMTAMAAKLGVLAGRDGPIRSWLDGPAHAMGCDLEHVVRIYSTDDYFSHLREPVPRQLATWVKAVVSAGVPAPALGLLPARSFEHASAPWRRVVDAVHHAGGGDAFIFFRAGQDCRALITAARNR
jgi:hypothetical protein